MIAAINHVSEFPSKDAEGTGKGRTHIRKPAGRQAHCNRTHQRARHNEQIRVRVFHSNAYLLHEREDNQCRNGVRNERRHDEDQ